MGVSTLVDLVKIQVLSSGTGPFELGPAVQGFRGIEALIDSAVYSYSVQSGGNYEVGTGVYLAGSQTLVRTPTISSAGNAAVAFPANVQVNFTALAADFATGGGTIPLVDGLGNSTVLAITQRAVTAAIQSILGGTAQWDLPDEANGDAIPAPGSGQLYLSAGVMKIA
jgi:hypothetical protein